MTSVNLINMKIENRYYFFLLLLLLTSCGVNHQENRSYSSISGLISEVRSKSILEVDWFELETENLLKRRFVVEEQIKEFTPTHFRYHMVMGQSVKVDYRDTGGVLIAINVVDID